MASPRPKSLDKPAGLASSMHERNATRSVPLRNSLNQLQEPNLPRIGDPPLTAFHLLNSAPVPLLLPMADISPSRDVSPTYQWLTQTRITAKTIPETVILDQNPGPELAEKLVLC